MAQILDASAVAGGLAIDSTPKAARAVLYGPDGNPISRLHGGARATTDYMLPIGGVNDDNYRVQRMDRMGSSAIAWNNLEFHEPFEGTSSSSHRWLTAVASMTATQSTTAGVFLNSGASVTASNAVNYYTHKKFLKTQRSPLQGKFRARLAHVVNTQVELGFGVQTSATAAQTTGAYFQVTSGGVLQGVLTFSGSDISTSPISLGTGWQSNFYTWDIIMDDDEVVFMVQDTSTGLILAERRIRLPLTQGRLLDVTHLHAYARLINVTAPATAAAVYLSSVDVISLDANKNKPYGHFAAGNGFGAEVVPTTMAKAANYANSAAPTSATLSNTAAGYTTLGGQFQFAAVAGAETDFALFGFTVPSPYSFFCTGVEIDVFNMGAAVATTPHVLQWFASPNQSAITLAGTDYRVPLGAQSLPVGTAIGGQANQRIVSDFSQAPLATHAARIFVVGLKIPVGTATASQIIRGVANIKGYFE